MKSFVHINCKTIREFIWNKEREPFTEKLPESITPSKFDSHRVRKSGEFHSRKDSHSTKFEQTPQVFVKLSYLVHTPFC